MKNAGPEGDLFVLVADKNMEATFQELLKRHQPLGIRPITFAVFPHPRHDPGCRSGGASFLRPFLRQYRYALVVFDYEGCGLEIEEPNAIARLVEKELSENGWNDRSAAIVIKPELEAWAWTISPKLDEVCGWAGQVNTLRQWAEANFGIGTDGKPLAPKLALEEALRQKGKVRSSAVFRKLASTMSWRGCRDPAFLKLQQQLQTWFSEVS